MRSRCSVLVVVSALACAAGCRTTELAFRTDDRLEIVAPHDRAEVSLPLTVAWEVERFDVDGGHFAVFVDRAPPAPGRSVASLFGDDDDCVQLDTCDDPDVLAGRGIYVTDQTSVTVERVDTDEHDRDLHEATVVLLDGAGDRIGESSFTVEFRIDEPS